MKNQAFSKEYIKIIFPHITNHQITQLEKFVDCLREWNQRYNLISRKDVDRIWENHIIPSLIPSTLIEFPKGCRLLDIGSGGGFPAIPIKIVRPDVQMLLVDSVRKKVLFLKKIMLDLQIKNATTKRERIESLNDSDLMQKFDVITARAVTNISKLLEWSMPFLKSDGYLLLWKSKSDIEELAAIAENFEFHYEIMSVADSLRRLSPKFEDLRFFKIGVG